MDIGICAHSAFKDIHHCRRHQQSPQPGQKPPPSGGRTQQKRYLGNGKEPGLQDREGKA